MSFSATLRNAAASALRASARYAHTHTHAHTGAAQLAGKHALVTGATSGIGLAIARALARAGANVTINGLMRNEAEQRSAEAVSASLAADTGVRVALSGHDVAQSQQIESMFDLAKSTLGPVDIVVNNAGIQHVAPIEHFPVAMFDKIIAINLAAVWHASRVALLDMKARGYGRIINIASVHGLVASVNKSAYVASKHAVVGLTKAVALETAGTGVTCNAICPGWVLTPLVQAQIDMRAAATGKTLEEAKHELLREKQPSGEFVQTDDLGALAAFLCSDSARQMTGMSLPVDGGWTSQ